LIRQIATPGLETEWPSREDSYYRLQVLPIIVPSSREQAADNPLLVRYFVHTYAQHRRERFATIPTVARPSAAEAV
jgi:transcriptional regulator with PAS, ATPase and Fis domain